MSIFLLSSTNSLAPELSEKLKTEISKRGNRIAYIPSAPLGDDRYFFNSTRNDFREIDGGTELDYFDLGDSFSDDELSKIKEYKIVFLSGGNTFTFLDNARKRKLKDILVEVLDNGGLIIGVSAGAIIMTDTIDIALGADSNDVSMTDFTGFEFVHDIFYPHASFSDEEMEMLRRYTKTANQDLLICAEDSGVYYEYNKRTLFGRVNTL